MSLHQIRAPVFDLSCQTCEELEVDLTSFKGFVWQDTFNALLNADPRLALELSATLPQKPCRLEDNS